MTHSHSWFLELGVAQGLMFDAGLLSCLLPNSEDSEIAQADHRGGFRRLSADFAQMTEIFVKKLSFNLLYLWRPSFIPNEGFWVPGFGHGPQRLANKCGRFEVESKWPRYHFSKGRPEWAVKSTSNFVEWSEKNDCGSK